MFWYRSDSRERHEVGGVVERTTPVPVRKPLRLCRVHGPTNNRAGSRRARNPPGAWLAFREVADTENPEKARPAEAAGLHIREAGEDPTGGLSFPKSPTFRSAFATGKVRPSCRFRAGAAAAPEAFMLSFIPVPSICTHRPPPSALDAAEPRGDRRPHRAVLPVRPHARGGGRAAPEHGVPPSGAKLAKEGAIARQRRPGGVYGYAIASRFLPAVRGASHQRERGVPPTEREEQAERKQGTREHNSQIRGQLRRVTDERAKGSATPQVAAEGSGCRLVRAQRARRFRADSTAASARLTEKAPPARPAGTR